MLDKSITSVLNDLVDDLHRQDRLRVWSLVVTLFGDAIVPRGGEVWLGSILTIFERLNIEAVSVRAAMSRLAGDGWVERNKIGRRSYYSFKTDALNELEKASVRVYAPLETNWDGDWTILVISEEAGEARDERRKTLRNAGFGDVSPTVFLRPETDFSIEEPDLLATDFCFKGKLDQKCNMHLLGDTAWKLADTEGDYQHFIEQFSPLQKILAEENKQDPLEALVARLLLIHHFRRIVLRDPLLPESIQREDWSGVRARKLCADVYANLVSDSEFWLSRHAESSGGKLKNPVISMANRFKSRSN